MDVVAENGRQILSLVVVFALLGLTVWKLGSKRVGFSLNALRRKTAPGRAIESVERLSLTPQHTVHILRIHGEEILVATHPQGCTVLQRAEGRAEGARA